MGAFRTARLRALLYSLPIPITIVLVSTKDEISEGHLWGVLGLILFFRVTETCHHRRVNIYASVFLGLAFYATLAILTKWVPQVGIWTAALVVSAILGALVISDARTTVPDVYARSDLMDFRRILTISLSAFSAWGAGAALGPFLVTFPYSGIPLALDSGPSLKAISRNVTRNGFALLAFFVAAATAPSENYFGSLVFGWLGFAVVAIIVNGTSLRALLLRRKYGEDDVTREPEISSGSSEHDNQENDTSDPTGPVDSSDRESDVRMSDPLEILKSVEFTEASDNVDKGENLLSLRREVLKEIGRRTDDSSLLAVETNGRRRDISDLDAEPLLHLLSLINRALRREARSSWTDVTVDVLLAMDRRRKE